MTPIGGVYFYPGAAFTAPKASVSPLPAAIASTPQFSGSLLKEDPGFRVQGGLASGFVREHLMEYGPMQQQYIRWDAETRQFQMVHLMATLPQYEDKIKKSYSGTYETINQAFTIPLRHGEYLMGGFSPGLAIDQVNGRLLFADGRWMDGPTGDLYSPQGVLLVSGDPAKQPKLLDHKDC